MRWGLCSLFLNLRGPSTTVESVLGHNKLHPYSCLPLSGLAPWEHRIDGKEVQRLRSHHIKRRERDAKEPPVSQSQWWACKTAFWESPNVYNIYWFPWCECSHHDLFQATKSLKVGSLKSWTCNSRALPHLPLLVFPIPMPGLSEEVKWPQSWSWSECNLLETPHYYVWAAPEFLTQRKCER